MNTKILVAYASLAGATQGVAEGIAEVLTNNGLEVDILPVKKVKSLAPYGAVVTGSAIHGGKWMPDGLRFLSCFQSELRNRKFFAFYTNMALTMDLAKYHGGGDLLAPIRRIVPTMGECGFAGAVTLRLLPAFPERLIIKGIISSGMWREGDYRDWKAVRNWAESIAAHCGQRAGAGFAALHLHGVKDGVQAN
jgi:menaquinone-dependent protoporphyrinogen oxidase